MTDRDSATKARFMVSGLLLVISLVLGLVGCSREDGQADNPELRRELLEMSAADQAERTGKETWLVENDRARAERLREIIDEYGWPTPEMVGEDSVSAAWLIAQHADFDVAFQERILALMKEAAARGDADPTEVAFLTDRVAVNRDRPQTYGSQVGCVDGRAVPKPLADPERVDERRREVGLEPLEDYLAEMEKVCATEIGDGPSE